MFENSGMWLVFIYYIAENLKCFSDGKIKLLGLLTFKMAQPTTRGGI